AFVVVALLVDHAPAVLVHQDHAVPGRHEDIVGSTRVLQRLLEHHLRPPGAPHVPELGAESRGQRHEITLVRRHRAAAEDGSGLVVQEQLSIVCKTAAGEYDAATSAHVDNCSVTLGGLEAHHFASVILEDARHPMAHQDGHVVLYEALFELTHHLVAEAKRPVGLLGPEAA